VRSRSFRGVVSTCRKPPAAGWELRRRCRQKMPLVMRKQGGPRLTAGWAARAAIWIVLDSVRPDVGARRSSEKNATRALLGRRHCYRY